MTDFEKENWICNIENAAAAAASLLGGKRRGTFFADRRAPISDAFPLPACLSSEADALSSLHMGAPPSGIHHRGIA